jgi:putative serine protease PepD
VAASAACGAAAAVGALLAIGVADQDTDGDVREVVVGVPADRDPAEVARDAMPAIIRIEVVGPEGPATGSGVVFRDDGHLLTSADLVAGATSIKAVLHTGESVEAHVVGADPVTDIGVVRLDVDTLAGAPLGSIAGLQEGEATIAIGTASAPGTAPVITRTVVGDLDADLQTAQQGTVYGMLLLNSSQGQLAPGSVVLDQSGAVVGLTTPRRATTGGLTPTSADAVGEPTGLVSSVTYATPIDFARKVADDIITTGSAQHAWLGVHGSDIEQEGEGAELQTVVDQSPAAVAGLLEGDRVTAVDGRPIDSLPELHVLLREHRPGDTIELEYQRGARRWTCEAVLASPPAS